MQLADKTWGQPIEGTCLIRHGRAPRRSATNRTPMAWFECTCGEFKAIRIADVKPGKTISCGCKGKQYFIDRYTKRASNLPLKTQREMFRANKHSNPKKRLSIWQLATKFKLDKYVVAFAIGLRCKYLCALKAAQKTASIVINKIERKWLDWRTRHNKTSTGPNRDQYLAGLHWRDRLEYLALEQRLESKLTGQELKELMNDLENEVVIEPRWRPLDFLFA